MDFLPEDKQAKFNEGFYKVYRLSKLKEGCHDARLYRDYGRWFTCLQGMRSEIHAKLTKKSTKKNPDEIPERNVANEYEEAVNKWIENKKDDEVVVGKVKGKVGDLNIYHVLYAYELWIEDMKDKYKMGMPDEDSAYSALR